MKKRNQQRIPAFVMLFLILSLPLTTAQVDSSPSALELNVKFPLFSPDRRIDLSGTATPDASLEAFVNGELRKNMTIDESGEFSLRNLPLAKDENLIALFLSRGSEVVKKEGQVVVDLKPPVVNITIPKFVAQSPVKVEGSTTKAGNLSVFILAGADLEKPSRVSQLKNRTITEAGVDLVWSPVLENDTQKYLVYRNNKRIAVVGVDKTDFLDQTASVDKEYDYQISALDTSCNEGPKSFQIKVVKMLGNSIEEPSEVSFQSLGCSVPKLIEVKKEGEFTVDLDLQPDIDNYVEISFEDRAGHTAKFTETIRVDTQPPVVQSNLLEIQGPSFVPEVTVRGVANEPVAVTVFINKKAVVIEKSKEDGSFEIPVALKSDVRIDVKDKRVQLEQGTGFKNDIELEFVDEAGHSVKEGPVNVVYSFCGVGGPFRISPQVLKPSPSVLAPRLLMQPGLTQAVLAFNVSYIGKLDINIDPGQITLRSVELSPEFAKDFDNSWVEVNSLFQETIPRTYIGFSQIMFSHVDPPGGETTLEKEKNLSSHRMTEVAVEKGKVKTKGESKKSKGGKETRPFFARKGCLVPGFGCAKLYMVLEIPYQEKREVRSLPGVVDGRVPGEPILENKVQKQCIEMEFMIDRPVPRDKLAGGFLKKMVKFLEDVVESIDVVLKPLETVYEYLTYACFTGPIVVGALALEEYWSCEVSSIAGHILKSSQFDSNVAKAGLCENYLSKPYEQAGEDDKDLYDECLDCTQAYEHVIDTQWFYNGICDRVACPNAPTLGKYVKDMDSAPLIPLVAAGEKSLAKERAGKMDNEGGEFEYKYLENGIGFAHVYGAEEVAGVKSESSGDFEFGKPEDIGRAPAGTKFGFGSSETSGNSLTGNFVSQIMNFMGSITGKLSQDTGLIDEAGSPEEAASLAATAKAQKEARERARIEEIQARNREQDAEINRTRESPELFIASRIGEIEERKAEESALAAASTAHEQQGALDRAQQAQLAAEGAAREAKEDAKKKAEKQARQCPPTTLDTKRDESKSGSLSLGSDCKAWLDENQNYKQRAFLDYNAVTRLYKDYLVVKEDEYLSDYCDEPHPASGICCGFEYMKQFGSACGLPWAEGTMLGDPFDEIKQSACSSARAVGCEAPNVEVEEVNCYGFSVWNAVSGFCEPDSFESTPHFVRATDFDGGKANNMFGQESLGNLHDRGVYLFIRPRRQDKVPVYVSSDGAQQFYSISLGYLRNRLVAESEQEKPTKSGKTTLFINEKKEGIAMKDINEVFSAKNVKDYRNNENQETILNDMDSKICAFAGSPSGCLKDVDNKKRIYEEVLDYIVSPENEYIVQPYDDIFSSMRCVCIPGIMGFLKTVRMWSNALKNCFSSILSTGDGDAGACQAALSGQVCDLVFSAISCGIKKFGSSGVGSAEGRSGKRDLFSFSGITGILSAGNRVGDWVQGRYGQTSMFNALFNEKKVVNAVCAFAFTGTWDLDLSTIMDQSIKKVPVAPTVLLTRCERSFQGIDLFNIPQGRVKWTYRMAVAVAAGSDSNIELNLKCSTGLRCTASDYEGGVCDCHRRGKEETIPIAPADLPPTIKEGEFKSVEIFHPVDSDVRYDKAIIRLTWTDPNTKEPRVKEEPCDISLVGDPAPAYCAWDLLNAMFRCKFGESPSGINLKNAYPVYSHEKDKEDVFVLNEPVKFKVDYKLALPDDPKEKNKPQNKKILGWTVYNHLGSPVVEVVPEKPQTAGTFKGLVNEGDQSESIELLKTSEMAKAIFQKGTKPGEAGFQTYFSTEKRFTTSNILQDFKIQGDVSAKQLNILFELAGQRHNVFISGGAGGREEGFVKGAQLNKDNPNRAIKDCEGKTCTITVTEKDVVSGIKSFTITYRFANLPVLAPGSKIQILGVSLAQAPNVCEGADAGKPVTWRASFYVYDSTASGVPSKNFAFDSVRRRPAIIEDVGFTVVCAGEGGSVKKKTETSTSTTSEPTLRPGEGIFIDKGEAKPAETKAPAETATPATAIAPPASAPAVPAVTA